MCSVADKNFYAMDLSDVPFQAESEKCASPNVK